MIQRERDREIEKYISIEKKTEETENRHKRKYLTKDDIYRERQGKREIFKKRERKKEGLFRGNRKPS